MAHADRILSRLRDPEGPLDPLVAQLLDHTLQQPVDSLLPPDWVAARIVEGLQQISDNEATEDWIRARLEGLRGDSQDRRGDEDTKSDDPRPLSQRLPPRLISALRDSLGQPYQPDPELTRALLDHRAAHALMRNVLQDTLIRFGRLIRPAIPDPGRLSRKAPRLASLVGVAQGVAAVVGSEVERQLEGRVREFIGEAITKAVDLSVTQMCAPEFSGELSDWRADALDVFLSYPLAHYQGEIAKLDADDVVVNTSNLIRGLARWEGLRKSLEALLEQAISESSSTTLAGYLEQAGLDATWLPEVESLMQQRARSFVETQAFADWLEQLLEQPPEEQT